VRIQVSTDSRCPNVPQIPRDPSLGVRDEFKVYKLVDAVVCFCRSLQQTVLQLHACRYGRVN
jgi:hypothetical protein